MSESLSRNHAGAQAWQAEDRVDPYLRVALAMSFADHDVTLSGMTLTFELLPGHSIHALADALQANDRVRSHWQGEQAVFGTAWLTLATAQSWAQQGPPACLARFEVGMPWHDLREDGAQSLAAPLPSFTPRLHRTPSTADTLFVVMDHGCPFAHPALRRGDGQTKVLHVWDQGPRPELGEAAHQPFPWGYGAELDRAEMTAWLQAADGDEAACYARMGYHALQRRAVHGAHVLGQLQVQACEDLVFIQLPRAQLQTLSRTALAPAVLDGAMYALSVAAPGSRVIVNLSLEAYDGPHDAQSLWSCALQALVWHARQAHAVQWTWVIAAGNAASLKVNATLTLQPKVTQSLIWRVPPASEHVAWLELWWPEDMGSLSLGLTPPGHTSMTLMEAGCLLAWPSRSHPVCWVAYPEVASPSGRSVLIRLAPTATGSGQAVVAPAGDWTLHLQGKVAGSVRAYLARVWQSPGGQRRGRQGQLWPSEPMANAPGQGLLRPEASPRAGSLNGLASDVEGVVVAQAMRWQSGHLVETAYSGRGPARAASAHLCEASVLLHGLRGWGALGGQSVRMNGTSVAAPQAARALAWASGRAPP
jgi:hypothetical protein